VPTLVVAHPHFTYPGGASAVALETAQRLAEGGYDVHVVSLRRQPELTEPYPSVRFYDLGGPLSGQFRYWATLPMHHRRFDRVVDELAPDVVLSHVFPANYWAFTYRIRRRRVPSVWFCHEPSAFVHDRQVIGGVSWPMKGAVLAANPALQLVDRGLVRYADAIIANSAYTADRVRSIYGRTATVAYPGIEPACFAAAGPKEPLILAVGRLTPFKRFDLVLRAAAIVKGGGDEVRWVIVGDGEADAALRRLASDLGVGDVVTFAGRLDSAALASLYRRASIVAVTSTGEPFGIVPIEAMASGAAVICSDRGGPTETVRDGETGLFFRAGDAVDLAGKVIRLIRDPTTTAHMGIRGRHIAATAFTWDRTTEGVRAVLEAVRR
jgi:glycosyltransferase involved in cell wall biosynthesis